MANDKFIELSSKVYNKTAEREEMKEFVDSLSLIAKKGATNPQTHWEINEIITRTANEIIKPRLDFLDYIADVQRVDHGQKIEFNVPVRSKMAMHWTGRGTTVDYQRVGDRKKFSAEPRKIQGGAYYEIDQLLAGNTDQFVGVVDALVEDMLSNINSEVFNVLHTAMASLPSANRWTGANITPTDFDKVASVIQRYSRSVACLADIDFAKKIAKTVDAQYLSDRMKEMRNDNGYLGTVNSVDIVTFTNPFSSNDVDNTKLSAPREYAYLIPSGAEKPIKIGFEGDLQQFTDTDIESERVFLKVGQKASVDVFHDLRNIGQLHDTSLA